jgi:hypothetical protein
MFTFQKIMFVLVAALAIGCGRNYQPTANSYPSYPSPEPKSSNDKDSDSAKSPSASSAPIASNDSGGRSQQTTNGSGAQPLHGEPKTVSQAKPTPQSEPQPKVRTQLEEWREFYTWERYVAAPPTELSYWTLATESFSFNFSDVFRGMLSGPFFGAPPKREETYIQKIKREYEEMMDDEYYFLRVPKFRAPASATKGAHYTWVVAISPTLEDSDPRNKVAEESAKYYAGNVEYLYPGEAGEGSSIIIPIPRSEVQSLFGYWEEAVEIQYGIIEVDKDKVGTSTESVDDSVKNQWIETKKISYYNMKEDEVQLHRVYWKTPDGDKSAVIDLQFWKGSWRTNYK